VDTPEAECADQHLYSNLARPSFKIKVSLWLAGGFLHPFHPGRGPAPFHPPYRDPSAGVNPEISNTSD
jgi:hypothetical protein